MINHTIAIQQKVSQYVGCRLHCGSKKYCPFSVLNFYGNEAQACLLMLRKFPRKYVSSSTKFLILIILEFCGSEIVPSSQPVEQKSAHSALILTITQFHSVLYYWKQFLFSLTSTVSSTIGDNFNFHTG